jgi:seryl-tRNA synthetase
MIFLYLDKKLQDKTCKNERSFTMYKNLFTQFFNADGGNNGGGDNQNQNNNIQNNNGSHTSTNSSKNENMIPYDRFKEVNDNYKSVKDQLDQLLKEKAKAEEDSKKKQGEFESLYTDLKTKYDPLEQQFKQYQETFKEILKNKLESVPDKFKSLVPQGNEVEQLKWLENAEKSGLFNTNNPQSFGNSGDNPPNNQQKTNKGFLKGLSRF